MGLKIKTFGLSDIGLVRKRNEDAWAELPDLQVVVLADGMGGHQAGDVASREAVQAMCYLMNKKLKHPNAPKSEATTLLREAFIQTNRIVHKLSLSEPGLEGMGTTLCCLCLRGDEVTFGHVGDSRIYRYRQQELTTLTRDHSLLRELLDVGKISEEEASDFLYKNIVTKAIGTEPKVEPSVQSHPVDAGDIFMICSDGLTDALSDEEIQEILVESGSIQKATEQLVEASIDKGGLDNVTVVMIQVENRVAS